MLLRGMTSYRTPTTNSAPRRSKGRVTIQDVARLAGVAVSTVSRVLNASDYASVVTRDRVLAAAAELNYKANPSARGLRRSQTSTIGVLLSDLANPVYTEFIRGAEHAAQDCGYELLIADGQNSRDVQARMLQNLYERRIDALILRGPIAAAADCLDRFLAENVPVYPQVVDAKGPFPVEDPRDETQANRAAFRHLVGLGHRRIHFLSRGLNPQMSERFGALQTVLREAGMDPSSATLGIVQNVRDCGPLVRELAHGQTPPTAYIAGAHILAPYLLEAIRDAALAIPGDVSFICFGDSPWAVAYNPPISVVRFDYYEAGALAVQTVLARLCASDVTLPPKLDAEFIDRGSCGPSRHRSQA